MGIVRVACRLAAAGILLGAAAPAASAAAAVKYLEGSTIALPVSLPNARVDGVAAAPGGGLEVGVTVNGVHAAVAVYDAHGIFRHSFAADGGAAASRGPLLVAVGAGGTIYATAQGADVVSTFNLTGFPSGQIGLGAHLAGVRGLAVDGAGDVYVTSQANPAGGVRDDSVVKLAPGGALLGRFVPFPGAHAAASVLRGIAVAADGTLWVTTDGLAGRPPLVHLDAHGRRLPAPDLRVLLPTRGGGAAVDVDAADGLVYVSGTLGTTDGARLALAVLTPGGRVVDTVAGGAVGAAVLPGGDVVLAGFRSPPSTLRRLADLVDTSTLRRFHAQVVAVPPAGAAAAAPIASATAACAAGAAQNDGAVPLVVLPPSGRCGVELERWRSPCATGETTVPGRVFVGGQATGARVRAAADGGFFARVLPGAARAGSVVLEYGCRRGAAARTVLEWGGEIATPDATFTAVERRTRAPVPFARATLQRSAAAGAPFGAVPAGLVGPALAAETTGAGGVVRWALPQGRFRLKVAAFGYRPLTTGLLRLPIPAAGMRLALAPAPRQQAKLVRLAGSVGTLKLGARVRTGLRVAGLRLRIVRRRLRGVTVTGRAFRTAAGIRLRAPLAALRQAYPLELRAVRVRARGATTIRVKHVTFTLRRGVVTAIAVR
jgi:hypothetical protein